jgi:putative transposase
VPEIEGKINLSPFSVGYHSDEEMVSELLLAVNQNQPLGNERFYDTMERMAGQRHEARPRGPRLSGNVANEEVKGQGALGL